MLRYLSLFSGIGSPEESLKRLGIDFELVGFSEIDKHAIESYCAIHNISKELNLGDIKEIDIERLPKSVDLITHGSPCQSFSRNGKNEGGDEGSGTRSSLMWNTVAICEHCQPKIVIWENVRNVLSKTHIHNFEKYLHRMDSIGYSNYYKILNSKEFGIPHSRDRVFVVSIRKDINDGSFKFPQVVNNNIKLIDILESDVEDKYYIDIETEYFGLIKDISVGDKKEFKVRQATKLGYDIATEGDSINLEQPNSKTRRGRVGKGLVNTLNTSCNQAVVQNGRVRRITPLEYWRLMGFSDESFYKAKEVSSDNQLYKQAGNSIVVDVIISIFKSLFKYSLDANKKV